MRGLWSATFFLPSADDYQQWDDILIRVYLGQDATNQVSSSPPDGWLGLWPEAAPSCEDRVMLSPRKWSMLNSSEAITTVRCAGSQDSLSDPGSAHVRPSCTWSPDSAVRLQEMLMRSGSCFAF
ncbi:hypothetical protein PGT21_019909 [Puccinia graminis f. sp. tritici]|uniref:Uncharacterized protein n=1 Tax=Puccinia graminis f. sp. tritici TaxID=56615 RepID=A0A5B0PS57_PUCGR|nr:hypothetical protein PGT21_019909 [Puccinia graminis f. sp. tritici]KAA1112301.1 hypothetical protein PGTUg99_012484 [Puccinia graminis f. sp. tritici]